ncbi:MAG: hypothetical protein ACRDMA_08620 [Solirubrobacterales bacterium]
MEGQPTETPLKVCPHCSVASRTDADTCPSCGKPYVRGRGGWGWSWWLAIPIVAAAFLVGYFGISQLFDDEEPEGITVEQAEAVPEGVAPSGLAGELDGESPAYEQSRPGGSCSYYPLSDQPEPVWEFCFRGEKLESSRPVAG